MKNRPAQLVDRLKNLRKAENGILICVKLEATNTDLTLDFQPFQSFIEQLRKQIELAGSGEFYCNQDEGGFTGISRYEMGYLTINTSTTGNEVTLEVFLSNHLSGNILLAREIYCRTKEFFAAKEKAKHWFDLF